MQGVYTVERFQGNGKWGLRSVLGDILLEPKYDDVLGMRSEYVFVIMNKHKYGLYSIEKGLLVPPIYSGVHGNKSGKVLYVSKDYTNKWGLIDYDGNVILSPILYIYNNNFPDVRFVCRNSHYGDIYKFDNWYIVQGRYYSRIPDYKYNSRSYENKNNEWKKGDLYYPKNIPGRVNGDPNDPNRVHWNTNTGKY